MKIETMWCVRDPGPDSELRDICFRAEPKDLVAIIAGLYSASLVDRVRQMETLGAYTDETEARADAERRLATRDAEVAASKSTGVCRVWQLFGGHVRLYENGAVESWDAGARCWRDGWGTWGTSPIVRIDEVRHDEWRAAVGAYRAKPPAGPAEPR
jgi:hypothetical protein